MSLRHWLRTSRHNGRQKSCHSAHFVQGQYTVCLMTGYSHDVTRWYRHVELHSKSSTPPLCSFHNGMPFSNMTHPLHCIGTCSLTMLPPSGTQLTITWLWLLSCTITLTSSWAFVNMASESLSWPGRSESAWGSWLRFFRYVSIFWSFF